MSLQDILNADVGNLSAWLGQAAQWWLEELGQIVPAAWRRRIGPGDSIAELGDEGGPVRIWRRGRFAERYEGMAAALSAHLVVSPSKVLTRPIVLPPLPAADLRRLAAQELDRLTPLREDQVYFDIERAAGGSALRLGVIKRVDADAALERARRFGLTPLSLGVMEADGTSFDFLKAARGRTDRRAVWLWAVVAVLVAINVGVWVWKDMDDLAALRRVVELQRPTAAMAVKLRARVEAEAAARQSLLAERDKDEPLRVLDAATRAFPSPQWLERLEWNGRNVRLAGFGEPTFNVLAAVAAEPALGSPRRLGGGGAPATAGGKAAFDIVAERGKGPSR